MSRSQLIDVGVPTATIAFWVRSGRLHPVHKGVYAVGHRRISGEARWLAGVLACGAESALSFGAAGQSRGIVPLQRRIAVHVTVPRRSGANPDGVAVHRIRNLDPLDVSLHRGIPTTTATRTVWDLATVSSRQELQRAFRQAEKLRMLDRERLRALLTAAPSRKGAALIRPLLGAPPLALEATRSLLEETIFETCHDHGLPLPAVNVPLLGWEVDFLWERERFVVEADGGDHLEQRQRDRDNERDIALGRAGYLVRRYGWDAAQDRAAVGGEVGAIIAERGGPGLLGY